MEPIKGLEIDNLESIPDVCSDTLKVLVAIGNRKIYSLEDAEDKIILHEKESGKALFEIDKKISAVKWLKTIYSDVEIDIDQLVPAKPNEYVYAIGVCHGYGQSLNDVKFYLDVDTVRRGKVLKLEYGEGLDNEHGPNEVAVTIITDDMSLICVKAVQVFNSLESLLRVYNHDAVKRGLSSKEELWECVRELRDYPYEAHIGFGLNSKMNIPSNELLETASSYAEFSTEEESNLGDGFIKGHGLTLGDWYCLGSNKYLGPIRKFRVDSYNSDGGVNLSIDNKEVILKREEFDVSVYISYTRRSEGEIVAR